MNKLKNTALAGLVGVLAAASLTACSGGYGALEDYNDLLEPNRQDAPAQVQPQQNDNNSAQNNETDEQNNNQDGNSPQRGLGLGKKNNTPGQGLQLNRGDTRGLIGPGEGYKLPEKVAAKALPSVVSIDMVGIKNGRQIQGVGSGVVLDKEGHIITNEHVVSGATAIQVKVEGETYEADLIGTDPSSDLAVVKVNDKAAKDFAPIDVGNSDEINVGQWVMAIGSPFGLEQSVSTGIVSSLFRSTTMPSANGYSIYANLIQTDAAINPGNSGGALVNANGALIGINTLIESRTGTYSGVGFAIPVNYAMNIAEQIISGKPVTHAYLGVTLSTVNPGIAAQSRFKVDPEITSGALVNEVTQGSPAAEAGLQPGDVIYGFEGDPVQSADDLIMHVRAKLVGETVELNINRNGKEEVVKVKLGSDEVLQTPQNNNPNQRRLPQNPGEDQNADEYSPYDLYDFYQYFFGN